MGRGVIMKNIFDLSLNELKTWFKDNGEKPFRASQVFDYLYNNVYTFDEMLNINVKAREKLKDSFNIFLPEILDSKKSKDGTVKMLLLLEDKNIIETVIMKYSYGYSVCVSSQVGCKRGCDFCASTKGGLVRNLTSGEILSQVIVAGNFVSDRIGNIVLMGSGEPLDNYDNVIKFINLVTSEKGLNISQRSITLSTCGIVPKIYDLAKENLKITLAVSLHEVTDEKRKIIMPVANLYTINDIIKSIRYYIEKTGRRVSIEYALVQNSNDSKEDALKLSKLVKGLNIHVNLIPINAIKELIYIPSSHEDIEGFKKVLMDNGVETTVRREMGSDIDAACGQLRRSYLEIND